MLATPTTTRKELTLGMTTVQTAACKSSEPFHLPEDLSLPKPKSFMWVSAAILPAHSQKEPGVRGYDTAREQGSGQQAGPGRQTIHWENQAVCAIRQKMGVLVIRIFGALGVTFSHPLLSSPVPILSSCQMPYF